MIFFTLCYYFWFFWNSVIYCAGEDYTESLQEDFIKLMMAHSSLPAQPSNNCNCILLYLVYLTTGAGESGKSTVVKQMKILHVDGFSEE